MEKNTVLISLEKYDSFKKLEAIIIKSKFIACDYQYQHTRYYSLTKDEMIDNLKEIIDGNKNEAQIERDKKHEFMDMSLIALIKWKLKTKL
tara:strand:+ start:396 stop:668 length:273 start_codon:yes stop_codon:yes gene_type:complete